MDPDPGESRRDDYLHATAARAEDMKRLAVILSKISNDLRLLSSGPRLKNDFDYD